MGSLNLSTLEIKSFDLLYLTSFEVKDNFTSKIILKSYKRLFNILSFKSLNLNFKCFVINFDYQGADGKRESKESVLSVHLADDDVDC